MYNLNRVQIIGYLARDPEIRETNIGVKGGELTLITTFKFKDKTGVEQIGKNYHTVSVWRGLAEICEKYLKEGQTIYISGRLKTDSWETEDGIKKFKTRIMASEMIMLDSKEGSVEISRESAVMETLNRVEVLGNLTRDPEIRETMNGLRIANLSIATNFSWKSKDGENKGTVEYHNIVTFNNYVDEIEKYFTKGRKVYVDGLLRTRSFTSPEGIKRYKTEIVASKILAFNAKSGNSQITDAVIPVSTSKKSNSGEITPDLIPEINYDSEIKPEDLPF